ncbi:ribonuclease J [Nocardioides immobilis]|uniref:Ribonuclease J n=1 Tax=Nocardioides immobilis TaxID=2049295 RepID=A0A417XYQ6_9ACTN|nr:ribonuclease J [Nocardioides immobilis]RHW25485.1 ribonuclease J [Nocardioides immobilis]
MTDAPRSWLRATGSRSSEDVTLRLELPLEPPVGSTVRILALGGISEIGRNMTVVDSAAGMLVVDCGLLFPSSDVPGVDFILPDFAPIEDRIESIRGLVLTHGHEDHIGGVPYLLKLAPDIPVYGTKFTLSLLAAKLAEHRTRADLREISEGDVINVGPFSCEFFAVNHSVPDGVAVSVEVNDFRIFHTGDFKLDQQPLDGRLTDIVGFARASVEGVDVLLSDSTNADVPGHLPDEVDVAPNFTHIFEEAPGLVLVACFASHVHRVQQVISCAAEVGKRVALVGRSMERNMKLAQAAGLLQVPDGLLVAPNEIHKVERSQLVIACTGSQGEPMAVLSRLARDNHKVKVGEGDVVIVSARLIPGNETDVFRVINGLSERGVTVLHGGNANIHASGHAPAGELRQVLNLIKPRYLMPVHGEWRHLRAHAAIAKSVGLGAERVLFAPNGTVVEFTDGEARIAGRVAVESVMVDHTSPAKVDDQILRDRRVMGLAGILVIGVDVDAASGRLLEHPRVSLRGLHRDDDFLDRVREIAEEVCDDAMGTESGAPGREELEVAISRKVVRWLRSEHRRMPAIHVSASLLDTRSAKTASHDG